MLLLFPRFPIVNMLLYDKLVCNLLLWNIFVPGWNIYLIMGGIQNFNFAINWKRIICCDIILIIVKHFCYVPSPIPVTDKNIFNCGLKLNLSIKDVYRQTFWSRRAVLFELENVILNKGNTSETGLLWGSISDSIWK